MSFSTFARGFNFTLGHLKEFLQYFSEVSEDATLSEAKDYIETKMPGFKKTYYQIAYQMGLINPDNKDHFTYHKYLKHFSDRQLVQYLVFWFKTYYAPNPYINSDENAVLIYTLLLNKLIENQKIKFIDYYSLFDNGSYTDILYNGIKNYCNFVQCEIKDKEIFLSLSKDYLLPAQEEKSFIENEFPILDNKSSTDFYNRYSLQNFNKFFDTNYTFEEDKKMNTQVNGQNEAPRTPDDKAPKQIIFYGVPGAGKSYSINKELEDNTIPKENTVRVVFHPEYTNSDFLGQILPKLTATGINYVFTPGPFTQIVRKAYQHPEKKYALIIEEINRGNAAAIFGELFQLLDRLDRDEEDFVNNVKYTKYWSSYGIDNDCINAYLLGNYDTDTTPDKTPVAINFNQNTAIRLPANLSLFATMNTSDQNVFRLDNAFKRRWDMQLIPNKFGNSDDELEQANAIVDGFDFTWGAFREAVNLFITNPENDNENSTFSDKQLGTWFIKNNNGHIDGNAFTNKVLEYLWDDVFTDDFTIFNKDKCNTFERLEELSKTSERRNIFTEDFLDTIDAAQDKLDESLSETEEEVVQTNVVEVTEYTKYFEQLAKERDSELKIAARNSGYYGFEKNGSSYNFFIILNRKNYYLVDFYLNQDSVTDSKIDADLSDWYIGHNIDKNHCNRESYRFKFPKDKFDDVKQKKETFKFIIDKAYRQRKG